MRSNRVATAAVIAGLALLGSVSAGVSGIAAGAAEPMAASEHHHPDRDGNHDGPRGGHRF
jgi:hypothetical protein